MHDQSKDKLLRIAFILSLITIIYNIFEGLVSIFFGITDDTLALLGFGVDSFVEVISGLGIAHMILRMKLSGTEQSDRFEHTALRITGFSFYILAAGLLIGSVINIAQNNKPETTLAGIIISVISIITMFLLMRYKLNVGKKLDSNAVIADAHSTMTCFYLSIILLISSLLYELFHIAYIDILGSLGIAYFAYKEGKESFENARKVIVL